jgi:hypothetical protein
MASAASHRHKRPFQPEITSYFTRADRDSSESSPSQTASSRGAPELPHSVQVSLLNVGMRIRKAVPEGYKTHKTALFSDPTPARAAISSPASLSGHLRPRGELLPFCGLHKIGGLSIQPVSAQSEIDIFADEMPFNLSQESSTSTLSTDSMPAAHPSLVNLSKRRFEDQENEEQESDHLQDVRFSDSFCSSIPIDLAGSLPYTGYPISHTTMPDLGSISATRTIAKPKSRRKGVPALAEPAAPDVDFEDAEFLVWDEEMVGM